MLAPPVWSVSAGPTPLAQQLCHSTITPAKSPWSIHAPSPPLSQSRPSPDGIDSSCLHLCRCVRSALHCRVLCGNLLRRRPVFSPRAIHPPPYRSIPPWTSQNRAAPIALRRCRVPPGVPFPAADYPSIRSFSSSQSPAILRKPFPFRNQPSTSERRRRRLRSIEN